MKNIMKIFHNFFAIHSNSNFRGIMQITLRHYNHNSGCGMRIYTFSWTGSYLTVKNVKASVTLKQTLIPGSHLLSHRQNCSGQILEPLLVDTRLCAR